jgi:type II secretory pathway pseudopilin PulG
MICAICAAENPINGRYCQNCGTLLQGQREARPQPFDAAPRAPYTGPTETSGKAIGSLICGVLFFIFPIPIVAVILGHLALSDIRRAAGRLTGRGMAIGGLVLGYAGLSFIPILIIAAIAIPNLLRAKIAANEASAAGSLRTIVTAADAYQDEYSNGYPPALATMAGAGVASCDHAKLIGGQLASGRRNGYVFTYVALPATYDPQTPQSPQAIAHGCTMQGGTEFSISADPITRGTTGQRSFYSDQTGVIHVSVFGPANAASEILR